MNEISRGRLAKLGLVVAMAWVMAAPFAVRAQTPQPAGTLTIAGQPDQAALLRINGKTYVDVESLARITHGTVSFQGSRTILTLPQQQSSTAAAAPIAASGPAKVPQFSEAFLAAEIEALTQIREWRVGLVNAIQNNYPVTDSWVGKLRRSTDSKMQLASAAASTELDQKAMGLLNNEFANMQQMSEGFVEMQTKVNYISPDSFTSNAQDQKIMSCARALASIAASKQFQDDLSCH